MCWVCVCVCVCVLEVVLRTHGVVIEIVQKVAVVLFQRVFRNTKGNTRVGKCGPDIEVGVSAVACDYRCAHLFGVVRWGYLL